MALSMLIPPEYTLTPKISHLLSLIEASRAVIESIEIPPEVETNIRRQSILRSSLFSARIEGNVLTLDEIGRSKDDQAKLEVFNILKALNSTHREKKKTITGKDLLNIHKVVMNGLSSEAGKFRREMGAIFNSAGVAIYVAPPPYQILTLMGGLFKFINGTQEELLVVKACLAHYTFEKIHPFLDGNGRVGRILLQTVLQKSGYGMKGLTIVEEYLDNNRSQYYSALERPEKDVTPYLEFMLEALSETSQKAKELVLSKQKVSPEDYLLPRRGEILNIIRDQKLVSFDMVRRRFTKVNERTLRYDIKKLSDQGLVRKRGTTKGVYYEPTKNSTTSPSFIT